MPSRVRMGRVMKSKRRMLTLSLTAAVVLASFGGAMPAVAAEIEETASTVYTVDAVANQIQVVVTVKERNNKPPKITQEPCQKYRTEQYSNYESYQSWEYRYSKYHPGYYYWNVYYPGWWEPIYGWVTNWRWVTRTRSVPYWTTCESRTDYYTDSWSGAIPASATSVSASVNGRSASVSKLAAYTSGGEKYRNVVVNSARIWFGESRTSILRFVIPAGQPRSSALTRVNAAYLGFCPIGYGTTGGTVEIQIPKPYTMPDSQANWTVADAGTFTRMTKTSSSNMYQVLPCIQASNLNAYATKRAVSGSGKTIVIEGWPGDSEWLDAVAGFVAEHATPLERLTGLALTSASSDLRAREASSMLELYGLYSGRYDPKTNTLWVSESYDEETVVHELSHVWFNASMPKWMAEGLASWTSKRLLQSGNTSGPFSALNSSDGCFLFDSVKAFPKLATDLGSWGDDQGFKTFSPVAEGVRYQLACATVATMLDRLTDEERWRFYRRYASDAGKSAFGSDIEAPSEANGLRTVADFVALATDSASPENIDAWLSDIDDGELVGLAGDQALKSTGRKPALAAFNSLAAAMRTIGWDGTDAPIGVRQHLANGQYDVNEVMATLQALFDQPLTFFTQEEMSASEIRSSVRSVGVGDEAVVANVMRTIRESDAALSSVGRDWWTGRTPLDHIGAIVLGDPASLEVDALVALTAGDLAVLSDKSSAASRAAQWAGLTGGLLVLLASSGAIWIIVRRRNGLAIIPEAAKLYLKRLPSLPNGVKGRRYAGYKAIVSRFRRRIRRGNSAKTKSK